jgi:hypothetical protein
LSQVDEVQKTALAKDEDVEDKIKVVCEERRYAGTKMLRGQIEAGVRAEIQTRRSVNSFTVTQSFEARSMVQWWNLRRLKLEEKESEASGHTFVRSHCFAGQILRRSIERCQHSELWSTFEPEEHTQTARSWYLRPSRLL